MSHLLENLNSKNQSFDFIIAADTICVGKNGKIFEKPVDLQDHIEMIRSFSGCQFQVISSVVVACGLGNKIELKEFVEIARVKYLFIPDEAILAYCTDNPDLRFIN